MGLSVVSIWKSDGGTTVPPIFHEFGHRAAWHKVAIATDPERSEGAIKKRPNHLMAVKTRVMMILEQVTLLFFVFLDGDFNAIASGKPMFD